MSWKIGAQLSEMPNYPGAELGGPTVTDSKKMKIDSLGIWRVTVHFVVVNWLTIVQNWYKGDNTASFSEQRLFKALIVV